MWDVEDPALGPGCALGVFMHNPTALAITPDGTGVHMGYGSGKFDGLGSQGYGVMTATRDTASGLLTERRPGTGWGRPPYDQTLDLVVSPDSRNLYGVRSQFAGELGNGITAWARSGGLYGVQGQTGCASDNGTGGECADGRGLVQPRALVISPDGRFLYAAASEPGALTVFAREDPGPFNDVDRDGLPDTEDPCPEEPGTPCVSDDGTGGGPGGGPGSAPDGTLFVKRSARLRRVLKKGRLRFRVLCDERASVVARLTLPRKQAKRLKVKRALASPASGTCEAGSRSALTFKLKRKAVKRLRRARKVTPTLALALRDDAGNTGRETAKLTWRR